MSKKYRKVALTLVVKASATQQVRSELEEASDLIVADNVVYESFIEDRHSRKPAKQSKGHTVRLATSKSVDA